MHPDWLGNPEPCVAALLLSGAVVFAALRPSFQYAWRAALLGVGVVMIGEALVEIVEYPLMYSDDPNLSAYFDTLSDLANSLAGAVVGTLAATLVVTRKQARARAD